METSEAPPLEAPCVRAQKHYRIIDTPPERTFDQLLSLAASTFGVPYALLGFADCERIWFKSTYGISLQEIGREHELFEQALRTEQLLYVGCVDSCHPGPLPTEGWKFVAAAPLRCPGGNTFGALWLADHRCRQLSPEQQSTLQEMARTIVALLDFRRESLAPARGEGASPSLDEALHLAEERFAKALRASPVLMSVTTLDEGRFIQANEAFLEATGYRREEVLGQKAADLDLWESPAERDRLVALLRRNGSVRDFEMRWRSRHREIRDGSLAAEILELEGEACIVVSVKDVTEARRDPLTGLLNRGSLVLRLQREMGEPRLPGEGSLGLLLVNLDRFKRVNESLGQEPGDLLLRQVAARLREAAGDASLLARLGGDEFAVFARGVSRPSDLLCIAGRIHDSIARPIELHGVPIFVTASIGGVVAAPEVRQAQELVRRADLAMQRAKAQGGGRSLLYADGMSAGGRGRLELEVELRRALEEGRFELHFQPLVAVADSRIVAWEALLRCRHGERGLLCPGEFIALAEETGLIVPIGAWVLAEACAFGQRWSGAAGGPPPAVSVNLSSLQLEDPAFPQRVLAVLEETGLAPERLWLEITESILIQERERAVDSLEALRSRRIRVCLDDFGTGYSSMEYLAHLPIDLLKIDGCFIRRLESAQSSEIVHSLILLAHKLGLEVVGEGVEQPAQLGHLERFGCDYAQGFFTGRPVPAAEVERRLGAAMGGIARG